MTSQESQVEKIKNNCRSIDKDVIIKEFEENGTIILTTKFTEKHRYICGHDRNGTYYVHGDGHVDVY